MSGGGGEGGQGAQRDDRSIGILGVFDPIYTYYLGGRCVHACIPLCTRGYTVVYTRVHNFALSMSSVGCLFEPFSGRTFEVLHR